MSQSIQKQLYELKALLDVNDWVAEHKEPLGLSKDFLRDLRRDVRHKGKWKKLNGRHPIWRLSYLLSLFQEEAA